MTSVPAISPEEAEARVLDAQLVLTAAQNRLESTPYGPYPRSPSPAYVAAEDQVRAAVRALRIAVDRLDAVRSQVPVRCMRGWDLG